MTSVGIGDDLLAGVRVLDLTKATSGPFSTQILADLGADVIKIEDPPGGRFQRSIMQPELDMYAGMDPYFMSVNRGKRSVVLPLSDPKCRDIFFELVAHSDVVVDNYRAGVAAKLGVDHESLLAHNDSIITCSITGYGPDGPLSDRPAFDITVMAETGMLEFIGKRGADGQLAYPYASIGDIGAGLYCAVAVPAALHYRNRTGRGRHIDVAMFDALLSWFIGHGVGTMNFGESEHVSERLVWGAFDTGTRPLVITAHREPQWRAFCVAVGLEHLLTDPQYDNAELRGRNIETLRRIITHVLVKKSADDWIKIFDEHKVPYAEIRTPAEAFESEQARVRNMVLDMETPDGRSVKLVGNPIKTDAGERQYGLPPACGGDTASVLREVLGYSEDAIARLIQEMPRGQAR